MDQNLDIDELRNRLIGKIYDLVLHPDENASFMDDWDDYILAISSQHEDRKNASSGDEMLLNESGLEVHFARAHAILEKIGRTRNLPREDDSKIGDNILFRFDRDGSSLFSETQTANLFENVKKASDLAHYLDEDSAADWNSFLRKIKRAPAVGRYHVFGLIENGNIIAFNQRNEQTDEIELIVKSLDIAWSDNLQTVLRFHFELTERECELVRELTHKGSLNQIAQDSTQSKNTLRTQMKSVFRKMKVSSQPDLIQTVAMLAYFCETIGHEYESKTARPELGVITPVSIKNGVTVPVHFIGPEDGEPVFFIHGMLDGVAVTSRVLDELHSHNIRLIAPVRPNFGNAIESDETNNSPELFIRQAEQVLDELGLSEVNLFGHMSGAVFAFALAQKLGPRVHAIVNVAGGVPIISTRQFMTMAPRQRAFAYTARYAPSIYPLLLRAGVAQIDAMKTEKLMRDLYKNNAVDREVINDQEVADVVMDGYRFSVAQGYKGFLGDSLQVTRNWSEYVQGLSAKVLLMHGHHDPVVDFRTVQEFADREKFELIDFPQDGQLVFYSKPGDVLDELKKFIS